MDDIHIRTEGRAGRITMTRPDALNALTWDMSLAIEAALDTWAGDDAIKLVVIDAQGDKAFCAGGDIQDLYDNGARKNYSYGERFWRDEYRMNAKLFNFPKPVVTFMQGFTMGGGVGVGCHGSHRIVCENSQIAMPEVSIGLVPDVGGSLILARAPGRLGEYIGLTADRLDAGDAIYAGFADYFVPREYWDSLILNLCKTGDWTAVDAIAKPHPDSRLKGWQADIDAVFGGETMGDIWRAMPDAPPETIAHGKKLMQRHSPLSLCATVALIHKVRLADTIEAALDHEFRFTSRGMEHSDFLEGIRAAIIDKDRQPKWRHDDWSDVTGADVLAMSYPTKPPLDLTGAQE
ncbi:enoyl-CoA hydratase/isomerase family protein [Octadecabacter sp. 1_MG-2023]|uniref:enoyl-CoA hydratase/isomerase family protein n=1 Tax=unclassified Octadecabacter TaxID=196158 RepID=UPI001C0845B9|nr:MULTISPECIES: enoyl-CoA hydratase/isomerase family protein [unclassified Octadecabacter]MBU2993484.1 enoyl-CoA hydratase/isomerase family protein [Octadecabacter sp. B2R22]MDO6733060.1 enoyl-CoA hydratase/isomerase family protein [Octadecabacter sp. 1_MG-2023]